jgi:hypothetical protein
MSSTKGPAKRTRWFPAITPPAHLGWYEVRWADGSPPELEMQLWLGAAHGWFYGPIADNAYSYRLTKTGIGEALGDSWRGLEKT